MNRPTDTTLDAIVRWADGNDNVRAVLLTSTRARPDTTPDRWSDYDIRLVVRQVEPLLTDRSWVEAFGEVIVAYWDPLETLKSGLQWSANVIRTCRTW